MNNISIRGIFILAVTAMLLYFGIEMKRYYGFHMFDDLSTFNQVLWNMANRHKPLITYDSTFTEALRNTIFNYGNDLLELNYFGIHFRPILYLLAIPYNLYQHPLTLLFVKNLVLCLGVIPIYMICVRVFKYKIVGWLFALSYLFNPVFAYLQFNVPSPKMLFATFILFGFYFLILNKGFLFLLFAILGLACDLRMAPVLCGVGLYIFFLRNKRLGFLAIAVSILWFITATIILSRLSLTKGLLGDMTNKHFSEVYGFLKVSPLIGIRNMFSFYNFGYILLILASYGFVSLQAPSILAMATPQLIMNLTRSGANSISGSNTCAILPFVVLAAVFGVQQIYKRSKNPYLLHGISIYIFIVNISMNYTIGPALDTSISNHDRKCLEIIKREIPLSASLLATNFISPHLSSRRIIENFPNSSIRPDYIVADLTNYFHYEMQPSQKIYTEIKQRLNSGYGVYLFEDGLLILKKGFENTTGATRMFKIENIETSMKRVIELAPGVELLKANFSKTVLHPGDRFYFTLSWRLNSRRINGPILIKGIKLEHKSHRRVAIHIEEPYEIAFGFLDGLSRGGGQINLTEFHCVNHLRRRTLSGDYEVVLETPGTRYVIGDILIRRGWRP